MLAQLVQPTPEEILDLFDSNGDGKVTQEEFVESLKGMADEAGIKITPEQMDEAMEDFNHADTDGSHSVDIKELEAFMK